MLPELTRKKQALSQEECVALLHGQTRGVLCVQGADGYPYGMPMNHFYSEEENALYFHCGKVGHRLDALRRCAKASFCCYDGGERREGEWALHVKSVIAFGEVEIIENRECVVEIAEKLSHKFTQDEAYIQGEIAAYADKTLLLRLDICHLCGKHVTEA
ncbi:MAG: pyridoxamine 5'-phosphate oxidase family protein [Clostridia bacterium]|nr:pyridoxamine 5'-phosphate oxidase family protein [Clostridia bacterium]